MWRKVLFWSALSTAAFLLFRLHQWGGSISSMLEHFPHGPSGDGAITPTLGNVGTGANPSTFQRNVTRTLAAGGF